MKKRVLITGISGLLGNNLAHAWSPHWELAGVFNAHHVAIKNVAMRHIDLLKADEFDHLVSEFKPQVIVHCAALANIDQCEEDHALADAMNVTLTHKVAATAHRHQAKMVFISTDAVYDGTKGDYVEDAPLRPKNYYAQTKIKAEKDVLKQPTALVVRTSFYGFNAVPKQCLAEWIIGQLSQGKVIKGFQDVISSNIYTFDLADLLKNAIERDLHGVYNIGCSDALSKYDFAKRLAALCGLNDAQILPSSIDDVFFKAVRGRNLSMNTQKIETALGIKPPTSEVSLARFSKDYVARGLRGALR